MPDDPRGIITVLNTPFTVHDEIDLTGLRDNVRYALDAGVAGFLVPAMASEVDQLTPKEKQAIVQLVVDESRDRAVVIGGASTPDQPHRLQLAAEFLTLGCDGILVQMTAENGVTSMERDLQELADLQPRILMLQDWDFDGDGIPLPDILQLFERVDRFNWLKIEVAGAGPKYTQTLQATDNRLNVAGGWAVRQMIDGLDRGVHAFMPTGMHRIYCNIHRRYAAGDRSGAVDLFRRIEPVLAFSNQSLGISIRFFKRLLHAQGIYATDHVRIQEPPFDAGQEQTADRLIADVIECEKELASSRTS